MTLFQTGSEVTLPKDEVLQYAKATESRYEVIAEMIDNCGKWC